MRLRVWATVCLAFGMAFCGSAGAQTGRAVEGPCGSLFGSKICTSYRMRAGKISELTLSVPIAVVEQAPTNVPMDWPPKADLEVPFPLVVQRQTGFTYASVYWEAHGHAPTAFMVPHFDLHFYFAPQAKIDAVDCKDVTKPRSLPAGYDLSDVEIPHVGTLVGACIPGMGMHAFAKTDLDSRTPWKGSMIVGYYGGEPIFFEPMISNALLLEKRSFSLPIPQGAEPVAHVRYPERFRTVYLPKIGVYEFTFFY